MVPTVMRGRGGFSRPGGDRVVSAPAAPIVTFRFPSGDSVVGGGLFAIASSPLTPATIGVLRKHGRLDAVKSEWLISCGAHATLARELQALSGASTVQVRPLPAAALELLERGPRARPAVELKLSAAFRSRMRDFQVDAVSFAVARGGRVLIGDEMGCGKTISAIATALHYSEAWPLLILAPAGLRLNWKDELLRWVDGLRAEDVSIILTAKDAKDDFQLGGARVYIVGTSIVSNLVKERTLTAGKFEVIICDESHQLKTRDSARSKAVIPLLQAAKHVILLSGTPSPNRPRELFAQISAVNRSIFGSDYTMFSTRYCFGHQAPWGWSDVGASNTEELSALLREHIMVRRLKKDVLPELRRKLRTSKVVAVTDESRAELTQLERELRSVVARLRAADCRVAESLRQIKQGLEMRVFKAIGLGKAPAVVDYIFESVLQPLPGRNFVSVHDVRGTRKRERERGDERASSDSEDCGFFKSPTKVASSVATAATLGIFAVDALAGESADARAVADIHATLMANSSASAGAGAGAGAGTGAAQTEGNDDVICIDDSDHEAVAPSTTKVSKLVVFAHHKEVLDIFAQACISRGVGFIRIDGDLSANQKHKHCAAFRDKPNVQVALLAITAAGVGL